MLNLGYISEKIHKIVKDCSQAVKKCFFEKFKVLDLVSVVNTKRAFSILKTLVELYHICKFFKDEGIFLEGKWWGCSESRYLSLIKRKIIKKCEAITENYEKVRLSLFSFLILISLNRAQVKMKEHLQPVTSRITLQTSGPPFIMNPRIQTDR